jgi:hypothetical protein
MGVPTSDVSYTSATDGKGDHEVYKGHVVALEVEEEEREREKTIFFPLLSNSLGKERPSTFPKSGPLWKQALISEPYLAHVLA